MRIVRPSVLLAALAFALVPACRTARPSQVESAPASLSPTPSTALVAPSDATRTSPPQASASASRPSTAPAPAAAHTDAPNAAVATANRDKHGPHDLAQYIQSLQSDARVAELRVDVVLAKLALPDDAMIGDLGCGPGIFTLAFAKACPNGVVYASDIEPAELDVVRQKIDDTNRRNIVPVLASADDAHFPPRQLDVVFVADTYHHLDDRVNYLKRLGKALKPGGRLVILDYKAGPLKIGPPPEHKLPAGLMDKELVDAGWKLVERFDTHPYHDFEVWRLVQPWEK